MSITLTSPNRLVALALISMAACSPKPATDAGVPDDGGGSCEATCAAPRRCEGGQCVCVAGSRGCPCDNLACDTDAGDVCRQGTCVFSCVPGSLGCSCPAAPETCGVGLQCSNGLCQTCSPSLPGCPCVGGACSGLICSAGNVCRSCATVCATNQRCAADGKSCLPECAVGFEWNAGAGRCDPQMGNCRPDAGLSQLDACRMLNRVCVEDGGSASCGSCLDAGVLDGEVCRAPRDCSSCVAQNRVCTPPTGSTDSVCTMCLPGYQLNGGQCEPTPELCATKATLCDQQGRACEDIAGRGVCTACKSTTPIDDPLLGRCRAPIDCAARPMPCPSGTTCVPATATSDSTCQMTGVNCPSSCPSETGEGTTTTTVSIADAGVLCVCDTIPGYFRANAGVVACDADNDGWVTSQARQFIESPASDLRRLARCPVATISSIVLINERGQERSFPVSVGGQPLPLYETPLNDGQSASAVPPYGGAGSRTLMPSERNSMTKACISEAADVNDNAVPDVNEWARVPTTQISATGNAELQDLLPFYTRYSYFIELHRGWFEGTRGPASVTVYPPAGVYKIREKLRATGEVPMQYEPTATPFLKYCERGGDVWYNEASEPRALDFASIPQVVTPDGGLLVGMLHSSQFKCVNVNSAAYNGQNPSQRASNRQIQSIASLNQLPDGGLAIEKTSFELNQCSVATGALTVPAVGGAPNPTDPPVTCQRVTSLPDPSVSWVAAKVMEPTDFARGCVKLCGGHYFVCPGGGDGGCYTLCGDFAASEVKTLSGPAPGGGTYKLRGEVPYVPFSGALANPDAGFVIRPPPTKPL